MKAAFRAVFVGSACNGYGSVGFAVFIALKMYFPAVVYLYRQPVGKRVYNRRAYAVQTAGNFVSASAEFAARVKDCINNLKRGYSHFRVYARGNSASVVLNGNDVSFFDGNVNVFAVARQRLVYRIVHNFVYEMAKTSYGC